jgi:hypothetical protein
MLYQIIVRNGSANHYASADNQTCAHTIFNALTKAFTHVELWQGATRIHEYKNCYAVMPPVDSDLDTIQF